MNSLRDLREEAKEAVEKVWFIQSLAEIERTELITENCVQAGMDADYPKTEPLNTTFSVNWPAALDAWFRALLRQKPTTPPQVTNTAWEAWLTAVAKHSMSSLVFTPSADIDLLVGSEKCKYL